MRKDRKKDSYVKAAKRTTEDRKSKRNKNRIFASNKKGSFFHRTGKMIGVICLATGFFSFIAAIIRNRHYGFGHHMVQYLSILMCIAGVVLYFYCRQAEQRMNRFRYYKTFLIEKDYMLLSDMAALTGRTISFLQKDISKMIAKKLFLQANMNGKGTCLFLTKEAFRRYQMGQLIITADGGAEAPKEKESKTVHKRETKTVIEEEKPVMEEQRKTEDPVSEEKMENNYEGYLQSIERNLSNIHDAAIIQVISDICIRGQQILYFKDTTMSKEVDHFLGYFLPVTNTILTTYVELEKEGLAGEAADLSVGLNTIQHSFDLFVEKLIEGKRVDVEEEIAAVKLVLS